MNEQEIQLTPFERMFIARNLPSRSSFQKGLAINEMREQLRLTEDEMDKYGVEFVETQNGEVMRWDEEKAAKVDAEPMEFSEFEMDIIQETLRDLDKQQQLPAEQRILDLYKKIINP